MRTEKETERRAHMNGKKYVGIDVDQSTLVVAVIDEQGEVISESCIRTRESDIRELLRGLSGRVMVTFEEGALAGWLYAVIRPLVAEVIVCDPRNNKLIHRGNKGDRIDAKKLARLLRLGELRRVYHGDHGQEALKQLVSGYDRLVGDTTRTMNRLKGIFRSQAIRCKGQAVYNANGEQQWLSKLENEGMKLRCELLYEQLRHQRELRARIEEELRKEVRKHPAYKVLMSVPGLGEIRTAQIVAATGTPHRFRTKRQYWPYCGFGVVTKNSSEYEIIDGQRRRRNKPARNRGLNKNYNRVLKRVFKGAAQTAISSEPFKEYYQRLIDNKMRPEMARLTVARKISAITLNVWKKGEPFDPDKVNQAAKAQVAGN